MSMIPERIEASNQAQQSRIKPGEHPLDFLKRIQDEQAAQDPAYAERLEIAQRPGTGIVSEDGGTLETKGRRMPWHKH